MSKSVAQLRQQSKLPANQAGGKTVADFFNLNKTSIAAVLPKHVNADRMLKIALGALRTTPKLMECTTESLFGAVVQCAQLGLEPNTPMGHAYLVPFNNRKKRQMDVQVIPGYRGLIDLARRSGQIVSIAAHAVREHDKFEWEYGLDEKLRHVPAIDDDRGEITHVYAVAKLVGGGHAFEVMSMAEVQTLMRSTQSKGEYGPWRDAFEAMARKSVVRRLFKWLPVSIEMATATAIDEAADGDRAQNMAGVLQGEYAVLEEDPDQEEEAPEWPQEVTDDETGEVYWKDSRGIRFSPEYHAMGADSVPPVTQAGHFRKRRGCDAEALAVYEAGGYKDAPEEKPATQEPPWEPQETAPPAEESPTYPEVREAIERAQTEQDGLEARALLALYDGPDNLRAELEELIEARAAGNL